MKVSDYYPLSCLAYSVLQKKEVAEGWLDQSISLKAITPLSIHIHYSGILVIFSPLSDSYIPERWLSEDRRQALEPKMFNSETEFIHNTGAFVPFSVGPANCAGKSFALMELRMVVTLMVSRFDFVFEPGYNPLKWYDDMCDHFNMKKGQLPVRLSIRKA